MMAVDDISAIHTQELDERGGGCHVISSGDSSSDQEGRDRG